MKFSIPDMTCGHCVQAVQQAVQDVDAAASVEIDLAGRTADVRSTASVDAVLAAIKEAGYEDARVV